MHPGVCKACGLVECDEHWNKEQEARQEARRKQYKEWEKRALTGMAEGDDASDTRGVILIVAEQTDSSDSDGMTARFTFSYQEP